MRFIQFWILPSVRGLETRVQQRQYRLEDRTDRWLQIMGPAGTDGLDLAQDARALVAHLTERGKLEHTFGPGRGGYLYVIDGRLSLDGESLRTGDAAKVTGEVELELATEVGAELILIDVPLEFEPVGVWAGDEGSCWRGRIRRACRAYPEDSQRSVDGRCDLSVARTRISVDPAGNQVEHAGRSQVNAIRSNNSGIDRIALAQGWEGEGFPLFPLLPAGPRLTSSGTLLSNYAREATVDGWG